MVHEYSDPGCRRRSELNLSGFLMRSTVNGPGIRAVVWVQGCPIRCRGCFNRASWSFSPNVMVTTRELADRILAIERIDGVTFSGGEPFAQAGPLAIVAEKIRSAGLTVLTFSGYTFGELTANPDPSWKRLLAATDLLVAGPYREELAGNGSLFGSANRQVISLTGRLPLPSETAPSPGRNSVEFTIGREGSITMTGYPTGALTRQISAIGRDR